MEKLINMASDMARGAGSIQRQRLWSSMGIEFKGALDLVTEVDRECEEHIVSGLRQAFPDHDVLAEENEYENRNSRFKWIVDPLDGTTNYAHGFPWFAVSIALEVDGEVVVAAIYHTVMDELFTAIKGKGAWVNGLPLHVSDRAPLKGCLLASGFPYDRSWENENNFVNFINFQMSARGVRRAGSAALDLASVAAGRLDGYWECKLKPWDVAAGTLLVEEAGGRVTNHTGDPYSLYDHRILASNGVIHDQMLNVLRNDDKLFISRQR